MALELASVAALAASSATIGALPAALLLSCGGSRGCLWGTAAAAATTRWSLALDFDRATRTSTFVRLSILVFAVGIQGTSEDGALVRAVIFALDLDWATHASTLIGLSILVLAALKLWRALVDRALVRALGFFALELDWASKASTFIDFRLAIGALFTLDASRSRTRVSALSLIPAFDFFWAADPAAALVTDIVAKVTAARHWVANNLGWACAARLLRHRLLASVATAIAAAHLAFGTPILRAQLHANSWSRYRWADVICGS